MYIEDDEERKRTDAAFAALGIGGYDWPEVFKYASGQGEGDTPFWVLAAETKNAWQGPKEAERAPAFTIFDVATIDKSVDGEGDESDWIAIGTLKSGLWFSVNAGCDYTGWG